MQLKFYNTLKFEQERFPVSDCGLIYIVKTVYVSIFVWGWKVYWIVMKIYLKN